MTEICPQYLSQCWRPIFALVNKNGNIDAEGYDNNHLALAESLLFQRAGES